MTTILNPDNKLLHIDEMFAFISVDEHGKEGLCGMNVPGLGWIAMVGADMARVNSLWREAAHLVATRNFTGKKIKLVKFSKREEIEVIA